MWISSYSRSCEGKTVLSFLLMFSPLFTPTPFLSPSLPFPLKTLTTIPSIPAKHHGLLRVRERRSNRHILDKKELRTSFLWVQNADLLDGLIKIHVKGVWTSSRVC